MEDVVGTLTYEDIVSAVSDAVTSSVLPVHDSALDGIAEDLDSLASGVAALADSPSPSDDSAVYSVQLVPSQVDTAKGAARVLCTEGLILVVLLSALLGLEFFRVFTEKWGHHG